MEYENDIRESNKKNRLCENVCVEFDFPAHPTHNKDNNLCKKKTDRNQRWNEKSSNILLFLSLAPAWFYSSVGLLALSNRCWLSNSIFISSPREREWVYSSIIQAKTRRARELTIRAQHQLLCRTTIPYWKLETWWAVRDNKTNTENSQTTLDLSQNEKLSFLRLLPRSHWIGYRKSSSEKRRAKKMGEREKHKIK